MEELELKVANVKCGGCANAIQTGLQALPGVESIEVDIAEGMVCIKGTGVNAGSIQAKLDELGYPVRD